MCRYAQFYAFISVIELPRIPAYRPKFIQKIPDESAFFIESWSVRDFFYIFATKKRVMGIEPTYPAWKAGVLPLNYTRVFHNTKNIIPYSPKNASGIFKFFQKIYKTCTSHSILIGILFSIPWFKNASAFLLRGARHAIAWHTSTAHLRNPAGGYISWWIDSHHWYQLVSHHL